MKRREVVALLSAAVAWPLAARALASRRLGILMQTSAAAAEARGFLDAFVQALKEAGWVEGQNILFERRFADGKNDLLPNLAAELVELRVDAILTDSTPSSWAAKNATLTIPIVMAASSDAVSNGLVASFSRPGGNVTGMSVLATDLAGRRLQLLAEMVPGLRRAAVLTNPTDLNQAPQLKQVQTAAQSLGVEVYVAEAAAPNKLESAFADITAAHAQGLIVLQNVMFFNLHPRIVTFTAESRLPALFAERQVVQTGGLAAYGPSISGSFRRAAAYVDRILRGANPADLPVELPVTFEFAINLKTAKEIGLTIPDKLLSTADEVIE